MLHRATYMDFLQAKSMRIMVPNRRSAKLAAPAEPAVQSLGPGGTLRADVCSNPSQLAAMSRPYQGETKNCQENCRVGVPSGRVSG